MLQQPSEFIMYQNFPLDLNMHSSAERPDFKDIGLHLQPPSRTPAGQAFFLDAYSVRASVPSPAAAAAAGAVPLGIGIQGLYEFPFQAVYDPLLPHRLQHLQHYYQLAQQHDHQQQQQQQQQQEKPHLPHLLQIQRQQQQEHHYVPMAGASSLELLQQQQRQQLERRGCWFPNWQEVFHGFTPTKGNKHEKVSRPPQQPSEQVAVEKPLVASTVGFTEAQQLHMHPDGAQLHDPRPLLPPPLSNAALDLPQPPLEAEKKGNGIVDTTPPRVNVTELHDRHVDRAETSGMSEFLPTSSHLATAIVPCSQKNRNEGSLVPCTDLRDPSLSTSPGASGSKYITQSPAWLPPGWITEVQTRRTGTTAGTRDKYYKDLATGRRFRSRNEVIHFLQTGKGRFRKRRRRRAITSPGFGGRVSFLTHQAQSLAQQETSTPCLFLAPQPIGFVLGPLVNTQPVPSVPSAGVTEHFDPLVNAQAVPLVPPVVAETVDAPCQTPAATSSANSTPVVMLGLKRPVESRPQKSPVPKKMKVLSPKACENKEASRLWQWLQKPVARMQEQPQKQDTQKQVSMAGERKAPDIECQRNVEDHGLELPSVQRTAQLGRDIEAAQRTLTHLGKEMQSTIEKLIQTIEVAKGDLKLEADVTSRTDSAMSTVFQATQRLDSAMENLTEATDGLVSAFGSVVYATQAPDFNVGSVLPAGKQPRDAAAGVVQKAASRSYAAGVAEKPGHASGSFIQTRTSLDGVMTSAMEPSFGSDNSKVCNTQAAQPADIHARYAIDAYHRPDNTGACNSQAAHLSDVYTSYAIQRAQRPDLAMYDLAGIPQSPFVFTNYVPTQVASRGIVDARGRTLNVEQSTGDTQAYQKALEMSKQIMEARNKFAALNPKLDLSSLNPELSSRQRAKEVQKMKSKHARGLLVILGRELCHKAIESSQNC